MKIDSIDIHNFRKLFQCHIDFSDNTTLFVGANNSGKTSAMDALAKFLADRQFVFNDFTLSNHETINEIGNKWEDSICEKPDSLIDWEPFLPAMDVWIDVSPQDIHYVVDLIPTLKWRSGLLGVRLLYQPRKIDMLFSDYREEFFAARKTEMADPGNKRRSLFPKNLCEFINKKLTTYFAIKSYVLDPKKAKSNPHQETSFSMECLTDNPLKDIIRVDMVSAQRGFSDPDGRENGEAGKTRLSFQMRGYYDKHLDPEKLPSPEDIKILSVTEDARQVFDENLKMKFAPAIKELEGLGYPGVANPKITIKSKLSTVETLNHDSAVQYALGPESAGLMLPEKYNGLGYQNLISLVFDLISFRDGWMRKGKAYSGNMFIEPLHLVLIEEPEAHLHMQVQQVFIRKAYHVLRNHEKLGEKEDYTTQLVISTHSSHIAKEEKFSNLRYFKRLPEGTECKVATSKVVNLSEVFGKDNQTNRFATRYLQTTHCDLFFADSVIMVEGVAESTLIPHFIRSKYPKLNQRYISILSVNGKHSHRLDPLINALALPTLVITDLDSAECRGHHKKAVPERNKKLISGNYAITGWLIKEKSFDKLLNISDSKKIITRKAICNYQIRIAYQTPLEIILNGQKQEALSRTFEDCFIYTNLDAIRDATVSDVGSLFEKVQNALKSNITYSELSKLIFDELGKSNVKAEFALDLIYSIDPEMYVIPGYIKDGLDWLQGVLCQEVSNG